MADWILIGAMMFTQREQDVIRKLQQHKARAAPVAGEHALGNILVASGEITREQLAAALQRQRASGQRLGEELIQASITSKLQVDSGLLLQRKLSHFALAAVIGLAQMAMGLNAAQAAQKNAALSVSVRVVANAKLHSDYQATQLAISGTDLARGYIDIPAASRFSVASNSRSGYLMEFYPVGNLFASVQVSGLGSAVELGADGGAVVQRGLQPPKLTHELSFRFFLRPDTRAGLYPWPLLLSVRPLD